MQPPIARALPKSLHVFSLLYGGMTVLAGVLGAKQVALGPLAVEAGIFAFLLLVVLSSAVSELHGAAQGNALVRWGFLPLLTAAALTFLVLQLPTDAGMYEPAKEAFPIILGQSWRLMLAGVVAYGVSQSLNVLLFTRVLGRGGLVGVRAAIAGVISQIVDTLLFISIAFAGVRPIGDLILGQALAKTVLSALLVPVLVIAFVRWGRRLDGQRAQG